MPIASSVFSSMISKDDADVADQLTAPSYVRTVAPEASDVGQTGASFFPVSSVTHALAPEAPDTGQAMPSVYVGGKIPGSTASGLPSGGGGGGCPPGYMADMIAGTCVPPSGTGGGSPIPSGGSQCPTLASPCTNPLTGAASCCCPSGYVADAAAWACAKTGTGAPPGLPSQQSSSYCLQYPTAPGCPPAQQQPYPGAQICAQLPTYPGCQQPYPGAQICAQYPTTPGCVQPESGMSTGMIVGLGAAALALILLLK